MPFSPRPHTSLEYLKVATNGTDVETGDPIDPTGDVVRIAFMTHGAIPGDDDWIDATWADPDTSEHFTAFCLVGPGGDVELAKGYYSVFLKITDDPEIPVIRIPGRLTLT